ncbi:MAG: DUF1553 domain-containing protein, partial [Planctomycetes bacterium]|nr:DUF1553 domain-containing protein [Planctomycetota bacterium]
FLRMAEDGTFSNITGFVPDRMDMIASEMEILSSAIMGLSLKCARCHSHKFDPIPHRDYYRLLAVFKGAFDEHDWLRPTRQPGKPGERDRYLPFVTTKERKEWEAHQKRIDGSIAELQDDLKRTQHELTAKHVETRLKKLPVELHEDLRTMLSTPAEKRTGIQKYLAEKFEKTLRISSEELQKLDPQFKQAAESTKGKMESLNSQRKPEPLIRALWDRGEPSPTYISRRGNYLTPGRLVGPGVPSVLTDGKTPLKIKHPQGKSRKTGRRLAFANWLIKPDHPLTARVLVNRIWKEHFETGIVETLDDFGHAGARPSHPELLDWLATEFVRHGWSIKTLHRMIVTSSTYRQSSRVGPMHEKYDPDNQWFSRMPLKRMRAETLRDSLLFISGRLDVTPFGPPDKVTARGDGLVTSVESDRGRRRSIYVLQRRSQILTILENFDLPRMSPNCIQRPISTVAPQALHLMNNGLVHELGEHLAARVAREAGADRERQIAQVYLIALNRKPTTEEQIAARNALKELTAHWKKTVNSSDDAGPNTAEQKALTNFCHAIINSAAFIYID